MKLTNRERLMIFTIIVLLLVISLYFVNNYFQKEKFKAYNQGISDIILEQTRTGNIYYAVNVSGNLTIQFKPIQEICSGNDA